ncbi:MAG: 50S ribosomal protein L24 [Clostridia bacterium]|nr:50S ribosomal protein L24 [Clostridia bacterium]
MKKLHIRRDDTVMVVSGNDRGKSGKVLEVSPKEGKVIVQGVNIVKKHVKPRPPQENGGIVDVEGALYASKVQIVCPSCKKPTRVAHKFVEKNGKTKKVRTCAKCGAEL